MSSIINYNNHVFTITLTENNLCVNIKNSFFDEYEITLKNDSMFDGHLIIKDIIMLNKVLHDGLDSSCFDVSISTIKTDVNYSITIDIKTTYITDSLIVNIPKKKCKISRTQLINYSRDENNKLQKQIEVNNTEITKLKSQNDELFGLVQLLNRKFDMMTTKMEQFNAGFEKYAISHPLYVGTNNSGKHLLVTTGCKTLYISKHDNVYCLYDKYFLPLFDSQYISYMHCLTAVSFTNCSLLTLNFLTCFKTLKILKLINETKLTSINHMLNFNVIETIIVSGESHIADFETLMQCRSLLKLTIPKKCMSQMIFPAKKHFATIAE